MVLRQLINKSTYGTIGYIASEDDLIRMEQYILYNLEKIFPQLYHFGFTCQSRS